MRLLLRRVSRVFGPRRKHNADILALRGVVVADEIEDVYKVQRWLGEGQTAVVLLGERLADGKRYALKRFRLNDSLRTASEGLRDEVQVLRALPDHGGLVGLREIVSTPGYIYLAMELVAGGDLLSPIEERGAYSERAAQSIFAQMVDAVDAMHQANIVHRDLKPENVCFTDGGCKRLKIIDLGAAGFLTERGLSGLCGTPLYAAPEVTLWYFCEQGGSSPPRYDERVDLWSMGVALYVMLSGSAPFNQDQSVRALLRDVCKGDLGARRAHAAIASCAVALRSPTWFQPGSGGRLSERCRRRSPSLREHSPATERAKPPPSHAGLLKYATTGMATSDWRKISDSAKAVVQGLLRVDPNDRMRMPELRSHPWLAEHIVPLQRERGSDVNADRQDGWAQSTVPAEPDAHLLGSLNYLAHCVNPVAAATQPTDGLCLHVSNGRTTDKKAGTPPAVVTIMIENGAAFIAPGSHLSMPLGMVACSRVQILRWLSGNGPLVRELPANWFVCIVSPHGHGRSLPAPAFTTCLARACCWCSSQQQPTACPCACAMSHVQCKRTPRVLPLRCMLCRASDSALRNFFSCFTPSASDFIAFCREQGIDLMAKSSKSGTPPLSSSCPPPSPLLPTYQLVAFRLSWAGPSRDTWASRTTGATWAKWQPAPRAAACTAEPTAERTTAATSNSAESTPPGGATRPRSECFSPAHEYLPRAITLPAKEPLPAACTCQQ